MTVWNIIQFEKKEKQTLHISISLFNTRAHTFPPSFTRFLSPSKTHTYALSLSISFIHMHCLSQHTHPLFLSLSHTHRHTVTHPLSEKINLSDRDFQLFLQSSCSGLSDTAHSPAGHFCLPSRSAACRLTAGHLCNGLYWSGKLSPLCELL